jgi:hypothetical protein
MAMMLVAAQAARAETDQYCFDYLRSVESQLQRAATAKCNIQAWEWPADTKVYFAYCREHDAATLEAAKNQRESQVRFCEQQTNTHSFETSVRDVRITGGPGDYTIHWTIVSRVDDDSGASALRSRWIQIRVPNPVPGGVELQDESNYPPFVKTRADRYHGRAGDVVRLKWQYCTKAHLHLWNKLQPSDCTKWDELPLVMPLGPPEFVPARIAGLDPEQWIPPRYRSADKKLPLAVPGAIERIKVRLDGSREAHVPAAFQDGQGWTPEVRLRLFHRSKVLHTSPVMSFPADGVARFEVPRAMLSPQCEANVGVTGHCATLEVEVESLRRWTSGNVKGLQESMGSSRARLNVVTPLAEAYSKKAFHGEPPKPDDALELQEPPTITSACNAEVRLGTVRFAARQARGDGAARVPVELQYSSGESLWSTSPLLTSLPVVDGTRPAEYREVLDAGQLAKTAHTWRWRVKATAGERAGDWCRFSLAQVQPKIVMMPGRKTPIPGDGGTAAGKSEAGKNLPGGDYDNREIASAQQCQSICAVDARCKAWTWVKPGIQGPAARCWLKNQVPAARADACCTSGIK